MDEPRWARVKMESAAALQRKPGAGQGVQKSSLINPDWTRTREPDLEMSKKENRTKGCYWEKMQNRGQRPRQRGRTWARKSRVLRPEKTPQSRRNRQTGS